MDSSTIIEEDLLYSFSKLTKHEIEKLSGSKILITGFAGFLGQYHLRFFRRFYEDLNIKGIVGLDNYLLGKSKLISRMEKEAGFSLYQFDVAKDDLNSIASDLLDVDYVLHLASIASPIHYRKHPLETMDSNIDGLRRILDFYRDKHIKGFLCYSSSEIYGDPPDEAIPLQEEYRGNVSVVGPRACYDEAKRSCETLAYIYNTYYNVPTRIIRMFNVFGPGMNFEDYRVTSDFGRMIRNGEDITILSDGKPTRSFCYVADSFVGELKILLHNNFDYFNMGADAEEITMTELAERFIIIAQKEFGYKGKIKYGVSTDKHYLTHNPKRRFPSLTKARSILNYNPTIDLNEGIRRYLCYIFNTDRSELSW